MQISCKKLQFIASWNTIDSGFCQLLSPAVWSQVWQCETSVGLAQGCNHHREFPSLILHKLHIKLLQHLFFFPDLHSLNKGGDLYGKGMRSVSPYVVPWVSHHHMILVMELKMLTDPVIPICCSWRPWGDIWETATRHNTQTQPQENKDEELVHLDEDKTCI